MTTPSPPTKGRDSEEEAGLARVRVMGGPASLSEGCDSGHPGKMTDRVSLSSATNVNPTDLYVVTSFFLKPTQTKIEIGSLGDEKKMKKTKALGK